MMIRRTDQLELVIRSAAAGRMCGSRRHLCLWNGFPARSTVAVVLIGLISPICLAARRNAVQEPLTDALQTTVQAAPIGVRSQSTRPFARVDQGAIALLRQMLHPVIEYSADEETWIARGGGMTSRQTIKGDTNGNVVRHYLAPPLLNGDVMLTGPNRYAYYRASARTLTAVPPAGGAPDDPDARIVMGLKNRVFTARRTGNETIAGCNAAIVLVSPVNPAQQGYAKLWIDPATHIRLKIEIAGAANARVSTSELSNLVVGSAANVSPLDFRPARFGAGALRSEVKRQRSSTVQEAMTSLKFHPFEAVNLPSGFHLDAVQVVTGPFRVGLLLRYTDGMNVFTLTEHRVRTGVRPPPDAPAAALKHWYFPLPQYDVDVVYRGRLPAAQEQLVHDTLQTAR